MNVQRACLWGSRARKTSPRRPRWFKMSPQGWVLAFSSSFHHHSECRAGFPELLAQAEHRRFGEEQEFYTSCVAGSCPKGKPKAGPCFHLHRSLPNATFLHSGSFLARKRLCGESPCRQKSCFGMAKSRLPVLGDNGSILGCFKTAGFAFCCREAEQNTPGGSTSTRAPEVGASERLRTPLAKLIQIYPGFTKKKIPFGVGSGAKRERKGAGGIAEAGGALAGGLGLPAGGGKG